MLLHNGSSPTQKAEVTRESIAMGVRNRLGQGITERYIPDGSVNFTNVDFTTME